MKTSYIDDVYEIHQFKILFLAKLEKYSIQNAV